MAERIVSIGTMLDQIQGLTPKDVNEWESQFLKSVLERSDQGQHTDRLSSKQCEVIERIYRKHFA